MLTYLAQRLSTVSKDSWHYRLNHYALGSVADHIKRACPYWLVLVFVSTIVGTIRLTASSLYNMALYLGYYPWVTFWWLLGLRPRYWRGLAEAVRTYPREETMFLQKHNRYHSLEMDWRWYRPLMLAPFLAMVPIVVYVLGFGREQANWLVALQPYYTGLIAYGTLLVLIVLGNSLTPPIKWAYCAVCPELKVVESAPARSRAELVR